MRGLLHALFLISATLSAMPAGAAVYKCTINGETHYQDEPCPGDRDGKPYLEFKPDPTTRPEAQDESEAQPAPPMAESDSENASDEPDLQAVTPGRPRDPTNGRLDRDPPSVPAMPVDEGPMDRVAQLGADIKAAEVELRAVVDERRDVLGKLDVRLAASGDDAQLRAERRQRESEFRERRAEVSERLRRLRAELDSACPNGTFLSGTRQACR